MKKTQNKQNQKTKEKKNKKKKSKIWTKYDSKPRQPVSREACKEWPKLSNQSRIETK